MPVTDHAVAGHETASGLGDLERPGLAAQLPHGLDETDHAAGRTRLAARELTTVGVQRKRSVKRELCCARKAPISPFLAKP